MMPLCPQVRTFVDAAEAFLSPAPSTQALNADELDMIRLYLCDLEDMTTKLAAYLASLESSVLVEDEAVRRPVTR